MENEPFLIVVFPAEKDRAGLAALAGRFNAALTKACGSPPTIVKPDITAICLLASGPFDRISRALEEAKALDTQYLLVRADTPHATCGLSTTHSWLQRHLSS